MKTYQYSYRIDRRAGYQGSRPSVRGQAEVEKYATGHHYSEVVSSGWSNNKRHRTHKNKTTLLQQHRICIGSINTTTMKDPIKLAQCISQCKHLKHDITFMQETHIIGHSTIVFDDEHLNGWTYINSGLKSKASAGVGIALSPNVKLVDITDILEGRILLVRLILRHIKISAICAYSPTEMYAESSKQSFYATLRKAIVQVKKDHPDFKIVIGADMNATIGNDSNGSWTYLGKNNDDLETNDNGTRLLRLSEECKLYIMNSMYDSKKIHRHTWYSPTGFTKRIDYILTEWHIKQLSSNCRVYRKASIPYETNHRLLALSCSFPLKRHQKMFFSHGPPKIRKPYTNIKCLQVNNEIRLNFSNRLDEIFAGKPNFEDINTFEKHLTGAILEASDTQIPKASISAIVSPWTNTEFLDLLVLQRQCKDPDTIKQLNKDVRNMRTKLRNENFSDLANNINEASQARRVEEEFRLSKNYTMTKVSNTKLISNDALSAHFQDHLKERPIEIQPEVLNPESFPHVLPPDDIDINTDAPSIKEIKDSLKSFKNGKCQGTDKIHGEHLKYNTSDQFIMHLTLLLTTIWSTFVIPSSWLISSITCLFKNKGVRTEAGNYRGLSIMLKGTYIYNHLKN